MVPIWNDRKKIHGSAWIKVDPNHSGSPNVLPACGLNVTIVFYGDYKAVNQTWAGC